MKIDSNNLENTFVIGDVHGCYYTLLNLIEQLPQNADLIFVGDLCDKGNFSKEVIDLIIANEYLCIKGNHEKLYQTHILDAVSKNIQSPWSSDIRYGGKNTIKSYKGDIARIKSHVLWMQELPNYIEIDKYFITHGFALEFYKNKDSSSYQEKLLLNRYFVDTLEPEVKEDIINVFGHCSFNKVQEGKKFFCIDTACSNGSKLSALQLSTHKIYQEDMNIRDSSYCIKELTLDAFDQNCSLEDIQNISLEKECHYYAYDIISHDVLLFIIEKFKEKGMQEILKMEKRSVVFQKQLTRIIKTKY